MSNWRMSLVDCGRGWGNEFGGGRKGYGLIECGNVARFGLIFVVAKCVGGGFGVDGKVKMDCS